MESFRKVDMKAESVLGQFLDQNLYDQLVDRHGYRYQRFHDKETQLAGVDVLLQYKNTKLYIDEKASFYYANKDLRTFALEIDFIPKGSRQPTEGWFVKDGLATTYYIFMWLNVKCKEVTDSKTGRTTKKAIAVSEINSPTDFTDVDAMLISKKRLQAYLSSRGLNREELLQAARSIRAREKDSEKWIEGIGNVRFYYSNQLAEAPINVLVPKKTLATLARVRFLISDKGYKVLSQS